MSRDSVNALRDALKAALAVLERDRKKMVVAVAGIQFRKVIEDWENEWDVKQ